MSLRHSRTLATLAAIGVTAVLLSGCGSAAAPSPTTPTDAGGSTIAPTGAQPDPSADPNGSGVDATCESIVGSDLLAEFTAQGWTAKQTPFTAGGVNPSEGLQCTWADYSVPSGNLMIFGWAPITDDQATQMQEGLGTEGWLRDIVNGQVFITEDPMQAPTVDENGYGMTYEFGDGWVMVADTKQNLLLIQRPGA